MKRHSVEEIVSVSLILVISVSLFWMGMIVADARAGRAQNALPIRWSEPPGGVCRVDDPRVRAIWDAGPSGECEVYIGVFR